MYQELSGLAVVLSSGGGSDCSISICEGLSSQRRRSNIVNEMGNQQESKWFYCSLETYTEHLQQEPAHFNGNASGIYIRTFLVDFGASENYSMVLFLELLKLSSAPKICKLFII